MKSIIIKRGDDNKNIEKNIKIELFIQRQKQMIILLLSTIHIYSTYKKKTNINYIFCFTIPHAIFVGIKVYMEWK